MIDIYRKSSAKLQKKADNRSIDDAKIRDIS